MIGEYVEIIVYRCYEAARVEYIALGPTMFYLLVSMDDGELQLIPATRARRITEKRAKQLIRNKRRRER